MFPELRVTLQALCALGLFVVIVFAALYELNRFRKWLFVTAIPALIERYWPSGGARF